MKARYLKITAIILAVLMIAGMLGACKKNPANGSQGTTGNTQKAADKTSQKTSSQSGTGTNAKTSSTNAASPSEQKLSENAQPNRDSSQIGEEAQQSDNPVDDVKIEIDEKLGGEHIDLGGRTLVYATFNPAALPSDKVGTSAGYIIMYKRIKAAEEKYNFKMEFKTLPSSDIHKMWNEIASQTMAGINYADIVETQTIKSYPLHIKNNMIIPLDDYIDFNAPIMKANPYYDATVWNGKHYSIVSTFESAVPAVQYNKDLLTREGQQDILDLVESKQWTWDTFLEIAKNCTRDTNGDGIIDQWGILSWDTTNFAQKILYSNGVPYGVDIVNGVPVFCVSTPQGQRALQFVSDLAFVHKVYMITNTSEGQNLYRKGYGAMYLMDDYINITHMTEGLTSSTVAPLPMGPDVNEYQNFTTPSVYCLLPTCEIPREVAKIFAEICLVWDENLKPIQQLQEIKDKSPTEWERPLNRRVSSEREYTLSYKNLFPNAKIDYSRGFEVSSADRMPVAMLNLITPLLNGQMSVYQAIESVRPKAQYIIDEFK